jgi:hypothetical protein
MRLMALFSLFLLSTSVLAGSAQCFSHGRLIYNHAIDDMTYADDNIFVFKESRTHKDVIVWASECVIKF